MRKFIRRHLPDIDTLSRQRWFRWMGCAVRRPRLWHLNRRSVAGAVAIGLFCGLIPGPLQMLGAALGCVLFRKNLPVAIACTLFSNPLTIVPLYAAASMLGSWITGSRDAFVRPPEFVWRTPAESLAAYAGWATGLGSPLAVGLPLLALLLAGTGYASVQLCWRLHILHYIRQRARRRRGA